MYTNLVPNRVAIVKSFKKLKKLLCKKTIYSNLISSKSELSSIRARKEDRTVVLQKQLDRQTTKNDF